MNQSNDSVLSVQYGVVTADQVETARKLAIIGWKWNRETVQKGKLRLSNLPEFDLPGRHKLGKTVLVAVIEPDGAVQMGDVGVGPRRKAA